MRSMVAAVHNTSGDRTKLLRDTVLCREVKRSQSWLSLSKPSARVEVFKGSWKRNTASGLYSPIEMKLGGGQTFWGAEPWWC